MPRSQAPINIMTDAFDIAIGAVLQQYLDNKWCPLQETISYWTTLQYICLGLLTVYCAIKYFRHFLEAREFHVLTDHKPLTHSINQIITLHASWISSHSLPLTSVDVGTQ